MVVFFLKMIKVFYSELDIIGGVEMVVNQIAAKGTKDKENQIMFRPHMKITEIVTPYF